jgi:hypothetical protein
VRESLWVFAAAFRRGNFSLSLRINFNAMRFDKGAFPSIGEEHAEKNAGHKIDFGERFYGV